MGSMCIGVGGMGKDCICMGVHGRWGVWGREYMHGGEGHGEGVHVHGVGSMGKGCMCMGVGCMGMGSMGMGVGGMRKGCTCMGVGSTGKGCMCMGVGGMGIGCTYVMFLDYFNAYYMQIIIRTASFPLSQSTHIGDDSYLCTTIS